MIFKADVSDYTSAFVFIENSLLLNTKYMLFYFFTYEG
jgi:hypothetical protein